MQIIDANCTLLTIIALLSERVIVAFWERTFADSVDSVSVQMKFFDALQAKEGSVHQVLDLVPFQLQHFQIVQSVKAQTGDLFEFVLVHL